jgi:hypothetical protein
MEKPTVKSPQQKALTLATRISALKTIRNSNLSYDRITYSFGDKLAAVESDPTQKLQLETALKHCCCPLKP